MNKGAKRMLAATAVLMLGGLSGCGPGADTQTPPAASPASCAALNGQTLPGGGTITRTTTVAATAGIGEYCQVEGTIRSGFLFQVNLPTQWNNKLIYNGGGGWDGSLSLVPVASTAFYVTVASNGGHVGDGLDASFALNNPQAQNDFGYLSAHTTLLVAKELVRRRYGRDAQRHYFQGCSNGGREALIQASRYPADYDGILSIAPAHSFTELFQAFIRNAQAVSASGAAINSAKAGAIARAVVARCDANDGLADGIVSWPQSCQFDPGVLQCTGADNSNCLTTAQVAAARTIYSEYRANGSLIYPGWDAGGEDQGWPGWVTNPPTSNTGAQFTFADGLIKYWLTSNPNFNSLSFVPANYQPQLAAASATLDASPNLSTFFAQGRKLVLAHGTHDWAISYKGSIQYFNDVASQSGGVATRDAAMEFFLLPGVQHCGGGVGPYLVDFLEATTQWVEAGTRPSSRNLPMVKLSPSTGQLELSRPLCRYPSFPRYRGSGDVNSASSFSCATS
ncbi:MAG: tannase/feruloyl esterase family alpha/beta hydrolase [Cytophagales bacterium]|nr:tannase/feruloyl esterase family alpha/beta hydrolase [Rhizobacter sp.]